MVPPFTLFSKNPMQSLAVQKYLGKKNEICLENISPAFCFQDSHFQQHRSSDYCLKELYTSISTLAQKLVLTLLNNEFIFSNFDPVRSKNPRTFLAKKP